jgi:hypothetical protein
MVLLDWTRMGRSYCVAGAVLQDGRLRIVRPLPSYQRRAPVRDVGWPAPFLDGHSRWEVFELAGPESATGQAPHLEDAWVGTLRPRGCLASRAQRRAILEATLAPASRPPFGALLASTRSAAYLRPGWGERSLASVTVQGRQVAFTASRREGTAEPDYRVTLPVPGLGLRTLPVKDHFLLRLAEKSSQDLDGQVRALTWAVRHMGDPVVVRLGLSRAFQATPGRGEGVCWLMADGFFSLTDPQP